MPTHLKEEDTAPGFTLPTDKGDSVSLGDLAGRYVVLYFYPRDNTPGCTTEACSFRDFWSETEGEGAVVLGVSTDSVQSHQRFRDKHGLPFTLLSDADHQVAEAYGVYGPKKTGGRQFLGVTRTTFLIGPDGRLIKVWPKVKPAGHAEEVLTWLRQHKGGYHPR